MEHQYEDVLVAYKDDSEPFTAIIGVGEIDWEQDPALDERVFFYVRDTDELESLYNPENGEDFYLIRESN